jgi:hypothetical protein
MLTITIKSNSARLMHVIERSRDGLLKIVICDRQGLAARLDANKAVSADGPAKETR